MHTKIQILSYLSIWFKQRLSYIQDQVYNVSYMPTIFIGICKNAKYSYKDLQSLSFKVKGNNGKADSQKLLPTNNKFVVIFSLQPSVSLMSNHLVTVTILNM